MQSQIQSVTLLPLEPTFSTFGSKSFGKFTASHRKEHGGFSKEYAVISATEKKAVVTLRLYQPGTVVYACLWIHPPHNSPESSWRNGSGYAGGHGYHKASAAAESAIHNAGIILALPIGGVGDSAIRDAVLSIAMAIDPDGIHILHEAHA